MTGKPHLRFDVDTLQQLAGAKVFARGEAYHRDGMVRILAFEPARVLAQVAGTEDYRTEITGRGTAIGGTCSCPAFDDWGFCKHMVAVALTANTASPEAAAEGAGVLARLRGHLKDKGIDALVEMIMDFVERDPALFRRLDMAAAAVHADDKTLEIRLNKAIDEVTNTRGFVEYVAAAEWAAEVDAVLDAVADLALGGRAVLARKLAERAIDRIKRSIENIDDSDGHCGDLLNRASDIHVAASRAAPPEPVGFARALFAREMQDDYGTFDGAATRYADILGEKGLTEYRRLATAAWRKLPTPSRGGREEHESLAVYHRLSGILDVFAERDGDVDARIALRAKLLVSPWNYFQLADFCRAQGREDAALHWAEEGLWVFEGDQPDERLVFLAVDLLANAGRKTEAEAHLLRAFEKVPSLELYRRLHKFGDQAARTHAQEYLQARVAKEPRTRWNFAADLLIRILMHEKMFDAAWKALHKYGASMGVKEALARASEATWPREALAVYAECVDQLANAGGNPAYAEAVDVVARMSALRSAAEHRDYVAALKLRFSRKRNFMKLLG